MQAEAEAELENFQKEIEKEKEEHKLSSMSDSEMAEYMNKLKEREEEKRQVTTSVHLYFISIFILHIFLPTKAENFITIENKNFLIQFHLQFFIFVPRI